MKSGYSISKLPNVNKNLLYELDVNKYTSDEEIIPEILTILKTNTNCDIAERI